MPSTLILLAIVVAPHVALTPAQKGPTHVMVQGRRLLAHASAQQGPSSREEEALAIVAQVLVSQDADEKKESVRKLSMFRYQSVAEALVEMLRSQAQDPAVVSEVEWALAAMSTLALAPLAAAVAGNSIADSCALTVLTRIARQDPAIVSPLMVSASPDVARLAAFAMLASGHPAGVSTTMEAWPHANRLAAPAMLQGICNVSRDDCIRLLDQCLGSNDDLLKASAAALLKQFGDPSMVTRCFPLLHSDNPIVVRAGLEALMDLPTPGAEKDLEILFDASSDDLKDQILDIIATIPSKESLAFLASVAERYPHVTGIGARARQLRRSASALMVISGTDATHRPARAVLLNEPDGRFRLAIVNSDGFRLIIEGAVEMFCARGSTRKTSVSPSNFDPDGTISLPEKCPGNKVPTVQWIRPGGQRLDARVQD